LNNTQFKFKLRFDQGIKPPGIEGEISILGKREVGMVRAEEGLNEVWLGIQFC
jgi:hypothetical protein